MGLNDQNNIEANIKFIDENTDDIVQKSNDLIIKVNNLHASNQNENTVVFRNKYQNENESEYFKAIEIHNLPKLNDLYINYKLNSTIKKSSIFVLVLKIMYRWGLRDMRVFRLFLGQYNTKQSIKLLTISHSNIIKVH